MDLRGALALATPGSGLGQHSTALAISSVDVRDVPSHSSMLVERLTSSIGTLLEQQLQVSCCPRLQVGIASDRGLCLAHM